MAAKNRRTLELKLGKIGIIVFVCTMSVLLFSVFLLGIVVGKHMEAYPEKYSAGLKDLIYDHLFPSAQKEGKAAQSVKTGARRNNDSGGESPPLTFYDTLSGKKGAAPPGKSGAGAKEQAPEISTPPPVMAANQETPSATAPGVGATEKKESPTSVRETSSNRANPLPEKRATVETGAGEPAAGPVAASPVSGQYEIQVAAYQERRKAEQMVEKLSLLGYSAEVVKKEIAGKGTWFRVIVSGFGSREKAKAASDRITRNISGIKCEVRPSGNNPGN